MSALVSIKASSLNNGNAFTTPPAVSKGESPSSEYIILTLKLSPAHKVSCICYPNLPVLMIIFLTPAKTNDSI